jgi:RNA recognition motif-containing protein
METKTLFVGGLSWNLKWQDLKDAFNEHGEVAFAKVITDRETNRSKGYGFVEFVSVEEAVKAKEAMDGVELDGREIRIDFAEDRKPQEGTPEAE